MSDFYHGRNGLEKDVARMLLMVEEFPMIHLTEAMLLARQAVIKIDLPESNYDSYNTLLSNTLNYAKNLYRIKKKET